jgi:predicted permease
MNWWQRLFERKKMEDQLEKELRFHVEQHADELISQGHNPQEARRRARLALGGPEQVKENCRDARGTRWLEDFIQDFHYAVRMLRKQPGFAAVALLTLALGGGATTVMFTVINGVLLTPLPYPESDKLVALNGQSDGWNAEILGEQNVAYLDFLDCARESRSMTMAGVLFSGGTVSEPGEPEYVDLREISSGLFSLLRVPIAQGRDFLPEDDRPAAAPVAILGNSFWRRHFAEKADTLGSSVVLDGKRFTVVGIAPAGFKLYGEEAEIYTPVGQDAAKYLWNRAAHPMHVVGRLQPGVTPSQAQSELDLFGRHLAGQFPDTNAGRTFRVKPLHPNVGNVGSTLWLLLGAVGLVLLVACVNVASLLLARAVSRERELAMRVALGATRSRLMRQCLTESGLLGLSGGFLGVILAADGTGPFVRMWPGALPRAEEVRLDWHVLVFALAVSILSGLLFGLAPALRAPFHNLDQKLRTGARRIAGSSRRLHSVFVISEIALAIILLVSAGMLGRTLLHLSSLDPGVDVSNVLVTRMALSPTTLADPAKTRAAWKEVLARGRNVPGVQSIATVDTFPMRAGDNEQGYWTSADVPPTEKLPFALLTSVSPDYLNVMRIPLRRGRFFDDHDTLDTTPVIVIDEVLARNAFGTQDPLGKRLWIPDMGYRGNVFEIVGVVGHVRHWGLAGDDQAKVRAQIYYPFSQLPDSFMHRWSELMSIAVRTEISPMGVFPSLRSELQGLAGDQVLYEVRTMEQLASESLAEQRFLFLLFGVFAGIALLLACIGIYGVLAYLTGQRVPEIGVRLALGATARDVIRLVLSQSLGMIFAGVGVGIAAALAAGRLLMHTVDGMQSNEASTFILTIPVLVVAALLASFGPARRASRIDPIRALRQD